MNASALEIQSALRDIPYLYPDLVTVTEQIEIYEEVTNQTVTNETITDQMVTDQTLSNPMVTNQPQTNQMVINQTENTELRKKRDLGINETVTDQTEINQTLSNQMVTDQTLSNQMVTDQTDQTVTNESPTTKVNKKYLIKFSEKLGDVADLVLVGDTNNTVMEHRKGQSSGGLHQVSLDGMLSNQFDIRDSDLSVIKMIYY